MKCFYAVVFISLVLLMERIDAAPKSLGSQKGKENYLKALFNALTDVYDNNDDQKMLEKRCVPENFYGCFKTESCCGSDLKCMFECIGCDGKCMKK